MSEADTGDGDGPDMVEIRTVELPPALARSLIEDAAPFMAVIRPDLTVGYVSPAIHTLLGHHPADMAGQPLIDYVHPDDLERAVSAVLGAQQWGDPSGATTFRVLDGDGGWRTVDVTASTVVDVDGVPCFAVYGVSAGDQHATAAVLARLLTGSTRAEALAPVLDVVEWEPNDSSVAIAWYEPGDGHRFVSTGLPPSLTGAEEVPGAPWARARATGEPTDIRTHDGLDERTRIEAEALDRGSLWVVPVPDEGTAVPALITIWGRADGRPAVGHSYGMQIARTYVDLILRWRHQQELLQAAADTDPLTGLPNRRTFFDVLTGTATHGALLFCDLDGFKPVNDHLGHDAGDEILRQVAQRLRAAARPGDLVARTGGDEFVVLAGGVSEPEAVELAARLAAVGDEPFALATTSVRVGVTVGMAHAVDGLTEQTLAEADRALLAAKAAKPSHPR